MPAQRLFSDEERFDASYFDTGTCHVWQRAADKDGYGLFTPHGKPIRRAHRFAWERANGPVPKGLFVLHKCDNPSCVNPAHLFVGTNEQNMQDMVDKRRAVHGEEHPKTTLTVEQVREIRSSAKPYHELAIIYGVARGTIWNVRSRRTWKHLD